jgi:hypothetical protein
MMRYFIVGAVAVVGYLGLDYLEPRIQKMLNLSPDNAIGVKAVKYGTLGGLAAITFWVVDKYVK